MIRSFSSSATLVNYLFVRLSIRLKSFWVFYNASLGCQLLGHA